MLSRKPQPKSERLEARITPAQKDLIRYASSLAGQSLTDFIIHSVQNACHKVIEEHQLINLSQEESMKFVEALSNPKKPNKKLVEAYKKYMEVVINDSEG